MANEKIIFDTEVKVGNSVGSVKSLKAELRAITNELGQLEVGSEAFVKAAQKAGELQDRIGDVKNTVAAFNPEAKFKAFADTVGIAANGFAAVQGAMSLMGSESEDLNKIMVKTQGAIALATGLNGLLGMGDALKNLQLTTYSAISGLTSMVSGVGGLGGALNALKTTLLSNPLFALGAVIVSIGVALKGFYDGLNSGIAIYKSSAKAVADLKKTYTSLIDEIKDLQIENDLANGKITQKDATLLREKNNFKKEFLAILKDANDKEAEIREQAAKERDDDSFKGTKNLLDKLGYETATTKAANQSLQNIEKQKQENIEALRKKYSLINSNAIIEETKNEVTEKTNKNEKIKANQKRIDDWKKERDAGILRTEEANREAQKAIDDIAIFNKELQDKEQEKKDAEKRAYAAQKIQVEQERKERELETLKGIAADEILTNQERFDALDALNKKGVLSEKEASDAKIAILKAEKDARNAALQEGANVLNQASELLGKSTAEGKVLAVASATISTYLSAQKAFESFAGIPVVGVGLGIAAAGVAVAAGIANVNKILSTPVPGNNGGGSGGGGISAPSAPRIPQSFSGTKLGGNSEVITTNKGEIQKVIVTETDITQTQNKVKGIIRKATIR